MPPTDPLEPDFTVTGREPEAGRRRDTRADGAGLALYLATVLDVFSRRILGWSMGSHGNIQLVCDAVTMAAANRGGRVAGGDRAATNTGGEYTSRNLELSRAGALTSTESDCYHNSMAESFHHLGN